jgi:hypothetical protein
VSEKAIPQTEPVSDDVNTTPPNPSTADGKSGWKMPEPVFRKTSGYLPQGFEKRFSQDEIKDSAEDNDSTAEMPVPEFAGAIEPQPELDHTDDSFNAEAASVTATAPRKSSGTKLIFTVVGLILAFALVAVLLAIAYFLYYMPASDGTF